MEIKDLSLLRLQIDDIDAKLLELYEARMAVCSDVAAYKAKHNLEVLDKAREEEKLAQISSMVQNKENVLEVRAFFKHIISASRRLQLELIKKAD